MATQRVDEHKLLISRPLLQSRTRHWESFLDQPVAEIWVDHGCHASSGAHFTTLRIGVRQYVVFNGAPAVPAAAADAQYDAAAAGPPWQTQPRYVPTVTGVPLRCQVLVVSTNPAAESAIYSAWLRERCGPEPDAIASFRFPALGHGWTLRSVLQALRDDPLVRAVSLPAGHRGDLLNFRPAPYARGHRDLVSQWMIRLNAAGIVSLVFDEQQLHDGLPAVEVLAPNKRFEEIINYVFRWSDAGPLGYFAEARRLPIRPGWFLDPRFVRALSPDIVVEDELSGYPDAYNKGKGVAVRR